jgi:hypothetical protein
MKLSTFVHSPATNGSLCFTLLISIEKYINGLLPRRVSCKALGAKSNY